MPLQIPAGTEESPHFIRVDATGQWATPAGTESEKKEYRAARGHLGHLVGGRLALICRQTVEAGQVEDEGVSVPDSELAQMGDVSGHHSGMDGRHLRLATCLFHSAWHNVDTGDLPTVLLEIDRLGSGAATQVERATGWQRLGTLDEVS